MNPVKKTLTESKNLLFPKGELLLSDFVKIYFNQLKAY